MTELDRAWAETQIEAMADGSLSADAEQRMLAAMERDVDLANQVELARAVKRNLGQLGSVPAPRGLLWRLWRIPQSESRRPQIAWAPAGVLAAAVVLALTLNVVFGPQETSSLDQAEIAAVQDFAVAVVYLQKSAVIARNEINEAVGSGVLSALSASSGLMDRTENKPSEGDRQNDD